MGAKNKKRKTPKIFVFFEGSRGIWNTKTKNKTEYSCHFFFDAGKNQKWRPLLMGAKNKKRKTPEILRFLFLFFLAYAPYGPKSKN